MGHSLDDGILYKSEEVRLLGDSIYGLAAFLETAEVLLKKKTDGEISQEDFDARFPTLGAAIEASVAEIKKQIGDAGFND